MSAVATQAIVTPEELLAMPDEKDFELLDGRLVERKMSALSSWIGGRLHRYLDTYVENHGLGWAFPADIGYQCIPDRPNRVLKPDVSFIRRERLPLGLPAKGYCKVPPDLAVEVISPNDLAAEIDAKVAEYRRIGVALVWVVHPEARAARVHRGSGGVSWLSEADEFSGEEVIPGFRCRVGLIFPPPMEEPGANGPNLNPNPIPKA